MIVDVRVRVCCAIGVTTAGEEIVEVEVDEVVEVEVDEVVDEVEEVEVLLDEGVVLLLDDVGELPAEDLDDALDVLSFGVDVGLGPGSLGKRKDIITAKLSLL